MKKTFLKHWAINNYYMYRIYTVEAGALTWLLAEPVTPNLVTRTAENEKVLKIILENDCINATRFQQRVR